MNKCNLFTIVNSCLLYIVIIFFIPTIVFADDKLIITDILEPLETEILVSFTYSQSSSKYITMTEKYDLNGEKITLINNIGIGIFKNLEINFTLPYTFLDESTYKKNNSETIYESGGFGDLSFGAKYKFIEEKQKIPATIFFFDVEFETANSKTSVPTIKYSGRTAQQGEKGGMGKNTINSEFGFAVSKKLGAIIPYYSLSYYLTGSRRPLSDNNKIAMILGSEYRINKMFSPDIKFKVNFISGGDYGNSGLKYRPYHTYSLLLQLYSEIFPNLTLIPSFKYYIFNRLKLSDGSYFKNRHTFKFGVSLYYLF